MPNCLSERRAFDLCGSSFDGNARGPCTALPLDAEEHHVVRTSGAVPYGVPYNHVGVLAHKAPSVIFSEPNRTLRQSAGFLDDSSKRLGNREYEIAANVQSIATKFWAYFWRTEAGNFRGHLQFNGNHFADGRISAEPHSRS